MITLYRILKFGLLNFWRNWILSSASVVVLAISILVISLFMAFNFFLQKAIESINQKVDVIVYFKDKTPEDEILDLEDELKTLVEVKDVEYISKEKALEKWLSQTENEALRKIISEEENPLPRSLEIKLTSAEYTPKIIDFLNKEEYKDKILKIRYNRMVVEKIISYSKAVRKVGIILSTIFVVISFYVVLNTLRLAIYSRKDEIEIMKLVGATPSYIVMPFVVEALIVGFLSAVIAFIFVIFGTNYAIKLILPREILEELSFLVKGLSLGSAKIFGLQVLLGVSIGVICSLIGVKRYLKS